MKVVYMYHSSHLFMLVHICMILCLMISERLLHRSVLHAIFSHTIFLSYINFSLMPKPCPNSYLGSYTQPVVIYLYLTKHSSIEHEVH